MAIASLMYHDVVTTGAWDESGFPGPSAASYKFEWNEFADQVAALAASGLRFPRIDAVDAAAPDSCLLTFDDGGVSAIQAARLLDRHNMVGHFMITGAMVGQAGFVSASDIVSLVRSGHVIGSHSHNHPADISRLEESALFAEWENSVARLAEIVGGKITVASVPGGFYTRAVARAAAKAGIRELFTSEPTTSIAMVDNCRILGRFALQRGATPALVEDLARGTGSARHRQWLLWNLKKPAKRWAAPVYRWLRGRLFGGT